MFYFCSTWGKGSLLWLKHRIRHVVFSRDGRIWFDIEAEHRGKNPKTAWRQRTAAGVYLYMVGFMCLHGDVHGAKSLLEAIIDLISFLTLDVSGPGGWTYTWCTQRWMGNDLMLPPYTPPARPSTWNVQLWEHFSVKQPRTLMRLHVNRCDVSSSFYGCFTTLGALRCFSHRVYVRLMLRSW